MAIAGAIGTGLIIGSGSALKNGGPGSMLIGYIIMGFIVYVVMVALGEMGAWLPHKKSFSGYASRFVDPALGYVNSPPLSYRGILTIICPAQICDRMELLLQICDSVTQQLNSNGHHHLVLETGLERVDMDRGIWCSHHCP